MSQTVLAQYQIESVQSIVGRWNRGINVLCSGPVGSGKTAVALSALQTFGQWPALVVVPRAVMNQWALEALQLGWHENTVHIYHGQFRTMNTYREWSILVTTPDTLRRELETAGGLATQPWQVLVVDEAHTLRNGLILREDGSLAQSNKTHASLVRSVLPLEPSVMLITATPFINHWTDLAALGQLLGFHASHRAWSSGRAAHLVQLSHTVSLIPPPVPKTTIVCVNHCLTQGERIAYRHCHKAVMKRLVVHLRTPARPRRRKEKALHRFLSSLTELRRGSVHPRFFRHLGCEASSKFVAVLRLLETELRNRKVVVFCAFFHPLQALHKYIAKWLPKRPLHLHFGGQGSKNTEVLSEFAASPKASLLLATRGSMGVGVNVSCAHDAVFLDRDFSWPLEEQAIGRIKRPHRQREQVWTAYYVTPSSPDCMHWMESLQRKKQQDAAGAQRSTPVNCDTHGMLKLSQAIPPILSRTEAEWQALRLCLDTVHGPVLSLEKHWDRLCVHLGAKNE